MKFTKITNEVYGARKAGYTLAPECKVIFDPEASDAYIADRGVNALDLIPDDLFDMDGDAYLGEDGEVYAVREAYINDDTLTPIAWVKLVKVGGETAESGDL